MPKMGSRMRVSVLNTNNNIAMPVRSGMYPIVKTRYRTDKHAKIICVYLSKNPGYDENFELNLLVNSTFSSRYLHCMTASSWAQIREHEVKAKRKETESPVSWAREGRVSITATAVMSNQRWFIICVISDHLSEYRTSEFLKHASNRGMA